MAKILYSSKGENFKDIILGFQDGIISTYVLVIAIYFLIYSNPYLLLIALIAELIAGSVSMGLGAYSSIKTKNLYIQSQRKVSTDDNFNKYKERGLLNEKDIEALQNFSEKHPKLLEKLDLINYEDSSLRDPYLGSLRMALAFLIGAILPIIPFFIPIPFWSLLAATILTFIGLFVIGMFRGGYSENGKLKYAIEMVLIGIIAVIMISIIVEGLTLGFDAFVIIERFS